MKNGYLKCCSCRGLISAGKEVRAVLKFKDRGTSEHMAKILSERCIDYKVTSEVFRFKCDVKTFNKIIECDAWLRNVFCWGGGHNTVYYLELRCDCSGVSWFFDPCHQERTFSVN